MLAHATEGWGVSHQQMDGCPGPTLCQRTATGTAQRPPRSCSTPHRVPVSWHQTRLSLSSTQQPGAPLEAWRGHTASKEPSQVTLGPCLQGPIPATRLLLQRKPGPSRTRDAQGTGAARVALSQTFHNLSWRMYSPSSLSSPFTPSELTKQPLSPQKPNPLQSSQQTPWPGSQPWTPSPTTPELPCPSLHKQGLPPPAFFSHPSSHYYGQ